MLAIDEMEIGLHGTGLAPGEITFEALEALAHALQLLATRLGRYYAGHEGPGRSSAAVERASCLRLRAVTAGSTVLAVAIGAQDQAVVDANHRVLDGIFDVFTGIARDEPPPWTTPLIGDAAVSLIDALARTSTRCDLRDPTRRHSLVRFHPRSASRLVWAVERLPTPRQADVSVSGRLDLVDLRRSRFGCVTGPATTSHSTMSSTRPPQPRSLAN